MGRIMNLFRFKYLRRRIIASFFLVLFLVIAMAVLNILGYRTINSQTEDIVEDQLPLLIMTNQYSNHISEVASLARGYIFYNNTSLKEEIEEEFERGEQLGEQLLALDDSEAYQSLLSETDEWKTMITNVFDEKDSGNHATAIREIQASDKVLTELLEDMTLLNESSKENIEASGANVLKVGEQTVVFFIVISIVIFVLTLVISTITARTITGPIIKIRDRMHELAEGDLSQDHLVTRGRDEIADLIHSLNTMQDNNRDLLNQINVVSETVTSQSEGLAHAADEVSQGTGQVAVTMDELARGAETQADSASNLITVMDGFTEKVENANENGSHIQANSQKVLELTEQGSQMMRTSTNQMVKINDIVKDSVQKMKVLVEQSEEITELVSVIRDIAEQTNLLALNAAIEAARAGEHGQGFAVVADEVRKLAEQVSLSVNDITQIVLNIQAESGNVSETLEEGFHEVEQGTKQIGTTEKTFNVISDEVNEVVSSINVITENLIEIVENNHLISNSIEEVASVSEQAAAGVEETVATAEETSGAMQEVASSAQELSNLAEELNGLVARFKL